MHELTSLVEQAILKNPSLQQTAIALQIAYAQRGVTTSGRSQYFAVMNKLGIK
ncbi:hypothetical protein [Moritella yayanosii]|uniref:Uncharacterized protein n=1 Tax=Moritella yayanosii TaxID=69539 RepID=A0A330LJB0_9GAMM|nr:hypothetical protein [Moritella yayanosii]SQD76669.1 protein of unknown function [Moritella yayanosii]